MSVYCITSAQPMGCTFFDWSIHFLSGQTHHYNIHQQQWLALPDDPVQKLNAHGYKKNHPMGFVNIQKFTESLLSMPQHQLYSTYSSPLKLVVAAAEKNIPISDIGIPSVRSHIVQYISQDFDQVFEFCNLHNVKLIYIGNHPNIQLYHLEPRALEGRGIVDHQLYTDVNEAKQHSRELFFKDSIDSWTDMGLTDIWDQREQQALDSRPFDYQELYLKNMTYPHLWINCQELWYNGEQAVHKMLNYLGLDIVSERLAAWKPIYAKWQAKQLKSLSFCYDYQHIVDSIVNNWYHEIDLTFDQEVVIQHCLIYQHNLNLKTWQLSKFPNNTQDLHKLLEPNTHPVTNY